MFDPNDTIVAVSSPSPSHRAIVRMTGPATMKLCQAVCADDLRLAERANRIVRARLVLGSDGKLKVDALLYLFFAPRSYTGDDVAEIHLHAARPVTELLINDLLSSRQTGESSIRPAGPGEFTARAYLAGKMDLSQAEAVNEVVICSNTFQLAAAEKMLSGQLAQTTEKLQSAIMELLSLIELGIDFSDEDIELISRPDALERLSDIRRQLDKLLNDSGSCELLVDLPAVGIAGTPNAGKSSLLNKLTGQARSIVSGRSKTTRDVLTGQLSLEHCRCVLFDCAGLLAPANPESHVTNEEAILDELAQRAAIDALGNSAVVMFCVDVVQEDFSQDITVYELMRTSWSAREKQGNTGKALQNISNKPVIPLATKCDLLTDSQLAVQLKKLNSLFALKFLPVSVRSGLGMQRLRKILDAEVVRLSSAAQGSESIALTARHRQAVLEAIRTVTEAVDELEAGRDEIAAMMLRSAYGRISEIDAKGGGAMQIDEKILDTVFSRFCIGK